MDNPIFSNYYTHDTQNITATGALITWKSSSGNGDTLPLLLNQLNITYSRNIQAIYPINVVNQEKALTKLQIMGAPQGILQCTGIITPTYADIEEFLSETSDSCDSHNVVFTIKPFQSGTCKIKFGYELTGLTLQSLGVNIQGNEVAIISQPLNFTFTTMKLINAENGNMNGVDGNPNRFANVG